MEIVSKVFKRRSGKSKGKWVVRIQYFDEINGETKFIERQGDKKSDVNDLKTKLIDDTKKSFGQMQTGERMTFTQLADICERTFYKPAVIVEGRKVAGVRSIVTAKTQIKILKRYFGKRLIRQITTESLTNYKVWRLKMVSERKGTPIKISTVNRELSAMRKMMRFAYGKGWILKDIFFNAKVIETSNEVGRGRLLTLDEENRLLNACQGERKIPFKRTVKGKVQEFEMTVNADNPHLKAMIMLAIDSGMRRGEIFRLRWQDIDFDNSLIRLIGTHTKTERERTTPLSQRAKDELNNLKAITKGENPFPFTDIKRSFGTAKKLAEIDNLHFHDLRRTAITRWLQRGTALAFAGKFAGHSNLETTMKYYISTDAEMIRELNEKMNNFNSQTKQPVSLDSEFLN